MHCLMPARWLYRMKMREVTMTRPVVSMQIRHSWFRPSLDLIMSFTCAAQKTHTLPVSLLDFARAHAPYGHR